MFTICYVYLAVQAAPLCFDVPRAYLDQEVAACTAKGPRRCEAIEPPSRDRVIIEIKRGAK